MKAAAWLIEMGYEVFLAVGSTSCDMIARDPEDEALVRVEVKTAGSTLIDGRRCVAGLDESKFDMLLVVLDDGEVWCNPHLHGWVRRPITRSAH
jgi:hypothetical protein